METDLLNWKQACSLLGGISRATFYRLVKAGEFGPEAEVKVKVGGSAFFRRHKLLKYLEQSLKNP